MNDVQAAAIARADASMAPALRLYDQRTKLMHMICRLPPRDLDRLVNLVARLTDDDFRTIAAFAEDLAEFLNPVSPVVDAESV